MKLKFYAVKSGREIGVFTNWDDCQKQVKGYPNAKYKAFKSLEEAEDFIKDKTEIKNVFENKVLLNGTIEAYVDGSYDSINKRYGYGVVIIKEDKVIDTIKDANNNSKWAEMRNVAGEIKAAMLAISYAVSNNYEKVIIYYDYQGIEAWAKGDWKAKKEATQYYRDWFYKQSKLINIEFKKVKAHSGNKFNDIADELAAESLS